MHCQSHRLLSSLCHVIEDYTGYILVYDRRKLPTWPILGDPETDHPDMVVDENESFSA